MSRSTISTFHWYVSSKPKAPADWGYSDNSKDAIVLTPWWQRRLAAYVRHCSAKDQVRFVAA